MYRLLTAKNIGITHFFLKSYNTTRTKNLRPPKRVGDFLRPPDANPQNGQKHTSVIFSNKLFLWVLFSTKCDIVPTGDKYVFCNERSYPGGRGLSDLWTDPHSLAFGGHHFFRCRLHFLRQAFFGQAKTSAAGAGLIHLLAGDGQKYRAAPAGGIHLGVSPLSPLRNQHSADCF